MNKENLFLIDAAAFCYRAFYAIKGLSTSSGQPTGAVFGFVNMLNKILKEQKPRYLAACFDVSRDTFRQKKFAEYKIQRPPMPDGLSSQMPIIKQVVSGYGIAIFEKAGYEADDIIATLAEKAKHKNFAVTIISSDKDILQLVDDDITVFSPYKDKGVIYDRIKVKERFGVEPERIADIISLMGDSIDNIPGVPGVGEKTAVSLLKEFHSLERLLDNLDQLKQPKLKDALEANITMVKLNKELACLDKSIDIDLDLDKLKIGTPNYKQLFRLFNLLEFKKFLKEISSHEQPVADTQSQIPVLKDEELNSFLNTKDELILYGGNLEESVFYYCGKLFKVTSPAANLKSLLADAEIKKIGCGLKETKVFLAKQGINLDGLYFDVKLAAYLLNSSKSGYDLLDIAWDYSEDAQMIKAVDNRAVYLIRDLLPPLRRQLEEKSLWKLFTEIEMPLIEVLAAMEAEGIRLDLNVFKELSSDIEKKLICLIKDIYALSGTEFNINSPKQLRDILFTRLKLPVVRKTKTGPSTDEAVLKALASQHELPRLLLEYRQLMKLKSTYVDTMPQLIDEHTQRLHTSFNQAATETGRLSSSQPNLQNIPVKTDIGSNIRRAIIAFSRESYLLSCDYSQIELRILAHLSGDESLIAAFRDNQDIHLITASLIYGLAEKDVTDAMRDVAKRVNFGIVYGLSAFGLSRDLGIALEDAQRFIDAYFLRYPKVRQYIDNQIKIAEENGFVTTILGRRRYLPEINNKNQALRQFAQRQAVNTPIQGSASDLIKLAMLDIYGRIKQKKLNAKMILQIHDELLFDVSDKELNMAAGLIKDRMENVLKIDVPIRVSMRKGRNWLEMEELV